MSTVSNVMFDAESIYLTFRLRAAAEAHRFAIRELASDNRVDSTSRNAL